MLQICMKYNYWKKGTVKSESNCLKVKVIKIIMPRTYEKKAKPYNDATIAKALKEISDGASISATSKKYKIGYGKLHADLH